MKGSLGRIQVCQWALRSCGDESVSRKDLRDGLARFLEHHRFLDVARMRPIPHEAYYANAGYFYFFGHYYAAKAIELLPVDEQEEWHARLRSPSPEDPPPGRLLLRLPRPALPRSRGHGPRRSHPERRDSVPAPVRSAPAPERRGKEPEAEAPSRPSFGPSQCVGKEAPHNAFTDLLRHEGAFYLAYREGRQHADDRGAIRLLRSPDGREWAALGAPRARGLRSARPGSLHRRGGPPRRPRWSAAAQGRAAPHLALPLALGRRGPDAGPPPLGGASLALAPVLARGARLRRELRCARGGDDAPRR